MACHSGAGYPYSLVDARSASVPEHKRAIYFGRWPQPPRLSQRRACVQHPILLNSRAAGTRALKPTRGPSRVRRGGRPSAQAHARSFLSPARRAPERSSPRAVLLESGAAGARALKPTRGPSRVRRGRHPSAQAHAQSFSSPARRAPERSSPRAILLESGAAGTRTLKPTRSPSRVRRGGSPSAQAHARSFLSRPPWRTRMLETHHSSPGLPPRTQRASTNEG